MSAGRSRLSHLIAHYRHKRVDVREPATLIRISKLYRPQMSPMELYDATRGSWKVGPQREKAKLASAVFEGVVREVYEIKQWFRAGRFPWGPRPLQKHPEETRERLGECLPRADLSIKVAVLRAASDRS